MGREIFCTRSGTVLSSKEDESGGTVPKSGWFSEVSAGRLVFQERAEFAGDLLGHNVTATYVR